MEDSLVSNTMLSIDKLCIKSTEGHAIIPSLNLRIKRGRMTALIGESGAGKTMLLKAIMGILPSSVLIAHGAITYGDSDLLLLSPRSRENLRGREISMVSQNPLSSFNPVYKIAHHFKLLSKKKGAMDMDYAYEILSMFSVPDIPHVLNSYPAELSGGMLQRLSFAAALFMKPKLLLLDEPTSSLDATVADGIYSYLMRYRDENDITVLIVTHELGRAAISDDIAVMYKGTIVERSETADFYKKPIHPYSRRLLAATAYGKTEDNAYDGICPYYSECLDKSIACNELDGNMYSVGDGHYVLCNNAVDKICE